jgi:hypothetical protein
VIDDLMIRIDMDDPGPAPWTGSRGTREELMDLLIRLQFAADRVGTLARQMLILVHGLPEEADS